MSISITGLIIGLILAVIFFIVATALVSFSYSALVFGLIALLIVFLCATGGIGVRR